MDVSDNPWDQDEKDMAEAGYALSKIPKEKHEEHLWADGLLLWWHKNQSLPTAWELAMDMFDEWDDPVSTDEAQEVLDCLMTS